MAYVDFSLLPADAPAAAAAAPARLFSATEWLVIALARRDPLSSLSEPGRLARAVRGLFGLGATSRLADNRLEKLRRLVVLARHHGWRLPANEATSFAAEFGQLRLEAAIVAAGRASDARRR